METLPLDKMHLEVLGAEMSAHGFMGGKSQAWYQGVQRACLKLLQGWEALGSSRASQPSPFRSMLSTLSLPGSTGVNSSSRAGWIYCPPALSDPGWRAPISP